MNKIVKIRIISFFTYSRRRRSGNEDVAGVDYEADVLVPEDEADTAENTFEG